MNSSYPIGVHHLDWISSNKILFLRFSSLFLALEQSRMCHCLYHDVAEGRIKVSQVRHSKVTRYVHGFEYIAKT